MNELEQAINNERTRIIAQRVQQQEYAKRETEQKQELLFQERVKYPQKWQQSEEIFAWMQEFNNSNDFKNLLEIQKEKVRLEPTMLLIYHGPWGDGEFSDVRGCWSKLYVNNTELSYAAGYKFMGISRSIGIPNAEALAESFHSEYIAKVHEHVKSNKVYEFLAKELEGNPFRKLLRPKLR